MSPSSTSTSAGRVTFSRGLEPVRRAWLRQPLSPASSNNTTRVLGAVSAHVATQACASLGKGGGEVGRHSSPISGEQWKRPRKLLSPGWPD